MTASIKKIFWKLFGQYRGLRRELYVLFWGKAATNMGAMIWPMLTLILSNKLGMNPQEIARITITLGIIQFPVNLLGGKLADHYNKKNLILVCDMVTWGDSGETPASEVPPPPSGRLPDGSAPAGTLVVLVLFKEWIQLLL